MDISYPLITGIYISLNIAYLRHPFSLNIEELSRLSDFCPFPYKGTHIVCLLGFVEHLEYSSEFQTSHIHFYLKGLLTVTLTLNGSLALPVAQHYPLP